MPSMETNLQKRENYEENVVSEVRKAYDELNRKAEELFDFMQGLQKIKSASDIEIVITKINELHEYLPGPTNIQRILKIDRPVKIFYQFAERCYGKILSSLIEKFDSNFPLVDGMLHESVHKIFTIDDPQFFLISFSTLLSHLKHSENRDAILALITTLLQSEGIFSTVCDYIIQDTTTSQVMEIERYAKLELFIQTLVSLPNTVANIMEGNTPHIYQPANFSCLLVFNIIKIIEFSSDLICRECEIALNFKSLSLLLSKTVIIFHNTDSLKDLIKIIELVTISSNNKFMIYKKIFAAVLKNLQRSAIETFSIMILQNVSANKNITNVLSERLIENKDWQFVLCKKIPLLSHYDTKLITNLITYLNLSSQQCLYELFLNLLTVWSDKFAFTRTSLEQHLYITKLIIVAAKHLKTFSLTELQRASVQKHIYLGIPAHLECGDDKMRVIGMVTGEIVSEFIAKPESDCKLQFEYDKLSKACQDLVRDLKNLLGMINEETCNLSHVDIILKMQSSYQVKENKVYIPPERKFRNKQKETNEVVVESATSFKNNTIRIIDGADFDLDSDDDLVPYDTSNDVKVLKKPPPAYLRDLRDGLLETQDAELFALSVENCEKLVLQQLSNDDASIGLEILEILLSLTPNFYVENFDMLVFQSCVAITCTYPAIYAEYLCKQFHADSGTYSICHRVLMLDILRESAKALAALKPVEQTLKRTRDAETAEEIIRKRLESKTRRFIKHKNQVFNSVNKFADVAGWFFFPLIYGYGKSKFISANDSDNVLLVYFLQTLSIIMCAAQNCAVAPKMARELFSLSWFLRFHKEAKVRMAVLSIIAAGILNVPKSILLQEFAGDLLEMRFWLMDLINPYTETEPNSECKILGTHVMCILEDVLKIDTGLDS